MGYSAFTVVSGDLVRFWTLKVFLEGVRAAENYLDGFIGSVSRTEASIIGQK